MRLEVVWPWALVLLPAESMEAVPFWAVAEKPTQRLAMRLP